MKIEGRFLARGKVIEVSFKRDLPPFSFCGNNISREKLDEIKVIKKTNNWEQGFVCPPCGYEGVTIVSPDGWRRHEIDPATLCQCTGLKDKSGKLIFERDILLLDEKDKYLVKIIDGNANLWLLSETIVKTFLLSDVFDGCEVIGNCFDNQGLLEG